MTAALDRRPWPHARPEAPASLARHPHDGWELADPYPMSPALVRQFHGLIRALCPPTPVVPDLEVRIEQQVRRMMRYMQPIMPIGFAGVVRVLDWSPIWSLSHRRRLHQLPRAEASAVLARLAERRGPVGDLVAAARAAVLAPYYDLDEVAAHVGWLPAPFMRGRVALRERLLAGGAPRPEDQLGPYSPTVAAAARDLGMEAGR